MTPDNATVTPPAEISREFVRYFNDNRIRKAWAKFVLDQIDVLADHYQGTDYQSGIFKPVPGCDDLAVWVHAQRSEEVPDELFIWWIPGEDPPISEDQSWNEAERMRAACKHLEDVITTTNETTFTLFV